LTEKLNLELKQLELKLEEVGIKKELKKDINNEINSIQAEKQRLKKLKNLFKLKWFCKKLVGL
jgi:hypothetical protein